MDDVEFLSEPSRLPHRRRIDPQPAADARVFQRRGSATLVGTLQCVGGAIAIAVALIMFVVHLFINASLLSLHASTTLPVILGIGLICSGISALRSPAQVTVDSQGIAISGRRDRRRFAWSEIGLANATTSLWQRRQLVLSDVHGQPLARISDNFHDFEQLVQLVHQHAAANPAGVAEPLRMKKARQTAILSAVVGAFLGLAAGATAWNTWDTDRGRQLLASSGVEGEARILRRFLAPNGVTCRLEYEVIGENGRTATRNAEVESEYWDELEEETTVPVRYVPSAPGYSELLHGDVPSQQDLGQAGGYALSAGGALISLCLFGVAIMQFNGYDFGTHPQTGKVGFFKLGT